MYSYRECRASIMQHLNAEETSTRCIQQFSFLGVISMSKYEPRMLLVCIRVCVCERERREIK